MVASPWGLYKSAKVIRILGKIEKRTGLIEVTDEGRHHKVELSDGTDSFPMPLSHPEANKFILQKLGKWLEKNAVCTSDEFMGECK